MNAAGAVWGVLLAAGRSRRFGADKLLHPLADGTPIAVASARALRKVLPRTIAVVRHGHDILADLLASEGVEVVEAPVVEEGMGYSLAAGVAATRDATGWLVALADMPFVQGGSIRRVAAALGAGADLVAPAYQGRRGHPVGFSQRFRGSLLALAGDAGARTILEQQQALLALVDCDDPGILRDVDRPGDV